MSGVALAGVRALRLGGPGWRSSPWCWPPPSPSGSGATLSRSSTSPGCSPAASPATRRTWRRRSRRWCGRSADPRIAAAILIGAALSVAGTAFQGLFRNPLVSPDILGASSGAALGAVAGIWLSLGVLAIEGMAFAGGLLAVACVYGLGAALSGRDPVLVLVLAGIVIGSLLGAGVGLIKSLADPYNQLPR